MEESEKGINRHKRLVLVPCPFQGHINPMLQVGTILHSKGFSITVVHSKCNSPDPSNHPNFDFLCVADELHDFTLGSSSADLLTFIMLMNENCKDLFQRCLEQLMEQESGNDETIRCIIYDEFMYFVDPVASQQKLPSIILRTTSATSFMSRNVIPWFEEEGKITLQGLGSQDIIPKFHPLRLKDLPFSRFGSLRKSLQLINYSRDTKSAFAVIFNTTDVLEQPALQKIQQEYPVPLFTIGPVHKLAPESFSGSLIREDHSCITWLDKQPKNSVLYISQGSLIPITQNDFAEMAWGLVNGKQPFLWVVRPGSVMGSDWIESLPSGFKESVGERGCIVKWSPQRKVLAHDSVGGFWSHCGWNSTLESISEGVPMICRPISGDQMVNARYVSYVWGVGLEFENDVLERGEVERVVRRLLVKKEGMEMRERAKDLKGKVEVCVSEGGSSKNSLKELMGLLRSF